MTSPERGEFPEYRARIMVEVVLCAEKGASDVRAVQDACCVKGYLEDPEIQEKLDEAGAGRCRIIGAWVQDVRRVEFGQPLPVDDILAADVRRRVEESRP